MEHNWERLLTVSPDDLPWSDYDDIKKQATEAQKVISTAQDIICIDSLSFFVCDTHSNPF